VNKDIAVVDIIKRLARITEFPEEAEEPIIFAGTSSERRPVYWATMRGSMPVDKMRQLAKDFVVPRFERIEGVGEVRLYGGEEREIQVVVDFKALSARGLTIRDLIATLQRENMNVRGGHIDQGKRKYLVRTVGLFKNIREIESVILKKEAGVAPVYVRDIAKVYDTFRDRNSMVRIQGQPAVAFGIVKKSGANTIRVVNDVESTIETLNAALKSKGVAV
jgi:HAE1 family hydrophobic/amphiphilic exporter-1